MPFYMFQGRYTTDSMRAMVKSPSDRETESRKLIEALGGKLHHLFFCLGKEDMVALIECPDDQTMASCTLAVGATGAMAGGATTKLITAQEAKSAMQAAQKAEGKFRPANA